MQSSDDSLQIYSELQTQKNAKFPDGSKRSIGDLKHLLEAIDELIAVRVNLRDLTSKALIQLEKDIRTIIIAGIRQLSNENLKDSVEASQTVLNNLYTACDELNNALEVLDTKGRTPQYYVRLRKCQSCIERALKCW